MRERLFSKALVSDVLDAQTKKVRDEIVGLERDYLLNASEDDLLEYLVTKHRIEVPTIRHDEIHALEPTDVKVDVSQEPMRAIFDRSRPFYITGTRVVVVVPFDGEADCFHLAQNPFALNPPHGRIERQELHLVFEGADLDEATLKQGYENELRRVEEYLGWVRSDVEQFNTSLPDFIRQLLRGRKEKLLKDTGLAQALGVPVRRRSEAALTFAPPEIRRKPPVQRPDVKAGSYVPEPSLPSEEYEFMLQVIHRVVVGIERSPQTFAGMNEEELRNVIVIILNSHYEGEATGETFNVRGKTDILIRHEDKNVFIAECKFWRGPKELLEAIDQVLRYVGWRDTKTAVIVFNRGQDHTAIIQKIKETVPQHPCFKRALAHRGESDLRFQFHQPEDKNRVVLLAVLAFDVPASGQVTTTFAPTPARAAKKRSPGRRDRGSLDHPSN
jgi:hypothetical protein